MPYRQFFKYFWIFVKPYRFAFFSLIFLTISRIMFSLILAPYIYKNIIDVLSYNNISIEERSKIVIMFITVMAIGLVSSGFSNRFREFINIKILSKITKDIYDYSFLKLANHSYKFYSDRFTGSMVAKIKRLARAFETIEKLLLGTFWFVLIYLTSAIIVLYQHSKILAFYLTIWAVLYIIVTSFFVKRKMKLDRAEAEADSKITGVLADSITNILNIKIFSSFKNEFVYFKDYSTLLGDRIYSASKFGSFRSVTQVVMMISFQIFMLFTMVELWSAGEITIGVFTLTYVYTFSIFERVWDLSEDTSSFMKATADMKEAVDIFETDIEIKDPEQPEICKINEGVIEFRNVYFRYKNENEVFENFNLKINQGEKVGIVGYSGSGKSTLTKLLLRFVDVNSGEILIDGQDISKIKQDDLRSSISFVPQEPLLFHRSVKENIGYSKPNASEEEIIDVAKKAYAHDFIIKLKYGYDTKVGERGVKLSGGERQRIAIARAMIKPAPILVLDEATSSLDSISENYIQKAFNDLMKDKTTIVIAHRLSTIRKMDRIVVLDGGKIVEEGNHQDLLKKNGFYASLWNHQTGGFM